MDAAVKVIKKSPGVSAMDLSGVERAIGVKADKGIRPGRQRDGYEKRVMPESARSLARIRTTTLERNE
jgi:hypothetical protein